MTTTLIPLPPPEDDDENRPVPVDPPEKPKTLYATVLAARDADRRPIVPAWARNRDEARALAAWLGRYGLHLAGYHGLRLPLYVLRVARRAPVGLVVGVVALGAWVLDREAAPLRRVAVERKSVEDYLRLSRQRNARVRQRAIGVAAATFGVALLGLLLGWAGAGSEAPVVDEVTGRLVPVEVGAPLWTRALQVAVVVAVLAGLAKLGTPADRRLTDVAVVNAAAPPRLTAETVTRALQSLGIAAMTARGTTISYPAPITRDGPGWRADVDLPHGVTVADVVERRDRLASALRRPLSAVWPEPSAEQHAGRLVLWVGDQPLNKVKPAVWPLLKAGAVDLLGGTFPFGVDQRQRPVKLSVGETNALVGSLPGGGKTAAVRVVALAAALDPHAELRVSEHKGSGDLSALEKVAHRYVSGVSDAAIEQTLDSLREVYAELGRRAGVLARLPRELVPDSKVTPELARRASLGLHPLVVIVDEAQEVFSHGEHGEEAGRLCEAIIKRGRALGVILVLATQRPDAKSLPTGVSTNVGVRFCLRVMDQLANDMVLGTSMYKAGVRATTLTPRDRGIGYLVGVADDPIVCRTYYLDREQADRIAERARAAREAAGTLSGYALGEQPEPVAAGGSLLDDLRIVFATITVERVWSEDVVKALAELRPQLYGALTPEALAALLRPLGITTGQVWGTDEDGVGRNRRGVTTAEVLAAIERGGRPPEITT
ncbi:cell division protein FtsK [Pseudonocardia sp.]|uniref:cell division protein FtsK n=1 Tax=Pseudonocardia sp. TaxID=60912 RepID=UPI003D0FC95F